MTLDDILRSDKPYFGDFLIAKQGPYEDYLQHFTNLVHAVRAARGGVGPLAILEVGSWAGGSLAVWDEASNHEANFVVVDKWEPYLNDPSSECHNLIDEAARTGEIYKLFKHNMRVLEIDKRLRVVVGNSHGILSSMTPELALDIVFIDGDHRYASARGDILSAMPLVREGGILCGDDLQLQVHQITDIPTHARYLRENKLNAHMGEDFYHPGVTQAVANIFGKVSTAGRLWAVQKVKDEWAWVDF